MLIGVFDSGIGGLTVLRSLRQAWPGHSTIYLGDTARVPYGSKSPQTVIRYARQIADFLLAQGIELLVVACNTASANALDSLADLPVPVIGVIEPGARAAAEAVEATKAVKSADFVKSAKSTRSIESTPSASPHIGVIGTRATIQSGAYQRALTELLPGARISARACPLLVPLADEGWEEGPIAHAVVREYLADWLPGAPGAPEASGRPSVLVLGCTHYPVLRPVLAAELGPEVALIDSAETTARALRPYLEHAAPEAAPHHRLFLTDGATGFAATAGRMLGEAQVTFEVVDLPVGAEARTD